MFLTRRAWILGASATAAYATLPRIASAQTIAPPVAAITPAQMREDLAYLQTQWAPKDLSFDSSQRLIFQQVVNDAARRVNTSSIADFALDVMRAAAIPRNGHTAAMVGELLGNLPIRMWWFADGLYVLSAHPSYENLVGARVEKLEALSPDDAVKQVAPYISGNDQRIRYLSAAYLSSPAVLHRIGAIADISSIAIEFRLRDGTAQTVRLGPSASDPGDPHNPVLQGWSAVIPDRKDLVGRWSHVLDHVDSRSPGYARPSDFSMDWLGQGGKVFYIRSNRTVSQSQDALDGKLLFGALEGQVVPKQPHSVIVDLRLNNGGNFFNTILFAQALPKVMPSDGRIFVLISRATFSAAIVTVAMLKGAGGDKVKLIGEPMGDNARFWAEPQIMTLPNSKIAVSCSTKLEDYEHGCDGLENCYWATKAFGPRNISLHPNIQVDVEFKDYAAGRDPVLEKALEMAQ